MTVPPFYLLMVSSIEEGRAASKSPHDKFGYFLSISQQAVSADITKNSAVGNIIQFLIMNIEINIYTVVKKDLIMCQRGNCPFSNLKI
jgi:hypothetical protein